MSNSSKIIQHCTARRRRSLRHRRNQWILLSPAASIASESPKDDRADAGPTAPSPSQVSLDELAEVLDKSLALATWDLSNERTSSQSTFLSLLPHDVAALSLPNLTSSDDEEDDTMATSTTDSESIFSNSTTGYESVLPPKKEEQIGADIVVQNGDALCSFLDSL